MASREGVKRHAGLYSIKQLQLSFIEMILVTFNLGYIQLINQ